MDDCTKDRREIKETPRALAADLRPRTNLEHELPRVPTTAHLAISRHSTNLEPSRPRTNRPRIF
ncbi:MAG: hypothetical protein WBD31_07400, partial [Rubripirellula sp.]